MTSRHQPNMSASKACAQAARTEEHQSSDAKERDLNRKKRERGEKDEKGWRKRGKKCSNIRALYYVQTVHVHKTVNN